MPRRTAEEAAETHDQIVDAARRMFGDHGYRGASTGAIVDAAGVTRGAMYHHFSDKVELFRAVFGDLERELDHTVAEAALARDDALGAFRAGCEACLAFMTQPRYRQIALVDAPSVLGAAEWHDIDTAVGMGSMRVALERLHLDEHLGRPPSDALVVLAFGALTQAGMELGRPECTVTADELIDELFRLLGLPG